MKWPIAVACVLAVACDPSTRRPTFVPRPEAAVTELELAVPAATQALAAALSGDSIPLARLAPRDGYVESPWLDSATMLPTHRRPLGPGVVRVRGWVDPSRHGYSALTVEVVYRVAADPSVAARENEAEVAYGHPARARIRGILGKLGGTPVDLPIVLAAKVPARRARIDTLNAPGTSAPNSIPSPVSADSGALLRGIKDSIVSGAPTSAPNQGQRAAPTPAKPAPVVTPADTTTRAAPVVVAPTPVAAAPAAVRYSVQIAAVKNESEANAVVAALRANGFTGRVVSESGWFKVRVGDYATAAAAQAALAEIKAKQGGAPFVVRR